MNSSRDGMIVLQIVWNLGKTSAMIGDLVRTPSIAPPLALKGSLGCHINVLRVFYAFLMSFFFPT